MEFNTEERGVGLGVGGAEPRYVIQMGLETMTSPSSSLTMA